MNLLEKSGRLPSDMGNRYFWLWLQRRYVNTLKKILALLATGLTLVVFTGYDDIMRPWLYRFWLPNLFSLFCLSLVAIFWDIVFLWREDDRTRKIVNQIDAESKALKPLRIRRQPIDPRQLQLDLMEKK